MYRRCWFRFVAALARMANGVFAESLQRLSTPAVVRFGIEFQVALRYQADPSAFSKAVLAGNAPAGIDDLWSAFVGPRTCVLNATCTAQEGPNRCMCLDFVDDGISGDGYTQETGRKQ